MMPEDRWSRLNASRPKHTSEKLRASMPLLVVTAILACIALFLDFGYYFASNVPSRGLPTIKTDQHLLIWLLTRILPLLLGITGVAYFALSKRKK